MKKKSEKYIKGGVFAAVLLTAISLQSETEAKSYNGSRIIESENDVTSNDNVDIGNDLYSIKDSGQIIVDDTLENSNFTGKAISQDTASDDQKKKDTVLGSGNMINNKTSENSDPEDVTADFTDPVFRSEVREMLRLNDDQPITKSACENITSIYLTGKNVKNLEGIKNFTNLTSLHCWNNELTNLDVSNCAKLSELWCYNNRLTSLNVSNCVNLSKLYCGNNKLTNLDVSSCTNLSELHCYRNKLQNLDVSSCTNLSELQCENNEIIDLDVGSYTNLSKLSCHNNKLTNLDISSCTKLLELNCNENKLTNLDIASCTNLSKLSCDDNELTNLDISKCMDLSELSCGRNQLTELDAHENVDLKSLNLTDCYKLSELHIDGCNELASVNLNGCSKITGLNLSGHTKLESLDVGGCLRIESLDLKDCSNLKSIRSFGNNDSPKLANINMEDCSNITELNFALCYSLTNVNLNGCSKLKKLSILSCSRLKELNLDGCKNLENINAESCDALPELDVSGCIKLRVLKFATYNRRTPSAHLNVSGCANLENLQCFGHSLKELDLSGCSSLTDLSCWSDDLEELNVTDCTDLEKLFCPSNKLKRLDVTKCTKLKKLDCGRNQLTSLDVSACTELINLDCSYNNMKSPDDVKGRQKDFDGNDLVFYPQNNGSDTPPTSTDEPDHTLEPTIVPTQTPSIKPTDKPDTAPSDESSKGFKKKYYLSDLIEGDYGKQCNIQIPKSGRLRFVFDECENLDYYIACWYKSTSKYIPFMITNKEETAYTNWCTVLPGTIAFEIRSDTPVNAEATLCMIYQPENTYIGEVEPNDSFDTANKIPLNTSFWGSESSEEDAVDGPDMDYFYFNVNSPSKMKITTNDLDHSAISLYKESGYGNVEYITTSLYYIENFFPVIRLSPGKYFLVINTRNIEDHDYSIHVNIKKESDKSYEQEDNDLSSKANKKKTNKWYTGNINIYCVAVNEYTYDRDWYQFKIPKKGYIEMGLRTPRQAKDSVIANLYDSSKKSIASIVSTENPYSKTKKILVNPGTYYIRVNCDDSYLGFTEVDWDYQIRLSQKSIGKKVQSPRVDRKSLRLYAGGKKATLKVSKAKGKITYKSQNPKVARVTAKGKVIPKKAGKTIIIIKVAGNSIYKPATIKVSVTVKK